MMKYEVNQMVLVSALVTGEGTEKKGRITKIERFLGKNFIHVEYIDGGGTVLTNESMLRLL